MKRGNKPELPAATRRVLHRVRMLRRARGISQAELAQRLGISQNAYCRIENGKRELTVARFIALSHALGVPPGELLDGDGVPSELLPDGMPIHANGSEDGQLTAGAKRSKK
jgi:transcriptional regulator with XRE-family HTH domain